MKVYDAASIRNVAIVGHGGCGKTQLVSTMLFVAGAVNRIGRVDEGTTVTDFDDEEIARKHTLSSSLAYAEWQKVKINIIDTPGFANFLTDARAALRVAEAAIVVVDAVAGVEVQTEKLWAEAVALGLPRIVALNRLDRDRASLERTLESLRRDCAREIAPVQIPLGEEKAFNGVIDLVRMKALTFAGDNSGKVTEGDIPEALLDRLLDLERRAGRVRDGARWGPRTLDLDLLLYGDRVVSTGSLSVPHPRLAERRFVLEGLAELCPRREIPGLGRTVSELLEACP